MEEEEWRWRGLKAQWLGVLLSEDKMLDEDGIASSSRHRLPRCGEDMLALCIPCEGWFTP